jgi:hypothetical protein
MLIYRDSRSSANPRQLLLQLRSRITQFLAGRCPSHDQVVDILIDLGTLETGLSDVLFGPADGVHPLGRSLRDASIAAGHLLWHSWHDQGQETGNRMAQLASALGRVEGYDLPASIQTSVAEGYAYYGVFPEMYLEAAKEYAGRLQPGRAVCLGLRSIGTSLSAVVAAALAEQGWRVSSWTLRPRGHPFSRRPVLTSELAEALRDTCQAQFFIVDEGPGISGSSFSGTAEMLESLGVSDDHIVLLPSWCTDGSQLRSARARERWPRHRRIIVEFEKVWINSGRLGHAFPGHLTDISAGAWRSRLYPSDACYPAVQPQHERRKYLVRQRGTDVDPRLLKFAGLGRRTLQCLARADRLAEAGFTTHPIELRHGFVSLPYQAGAPCAAGEVPVTLLQRIAEYLAYLSLEERADDPTSDATLHEMLRTNLAESLGEEVLPTYGHLLSGSWTERPVRLDARMQPHEWLHTANGYMKTDAFDHHDDHFLPGCQDIAWDLAGVAVEMELDADSRRFVIEQYQRLSGDWSIAQRLPYYTTSYLAFRLGYAVLAGEVLGESSSDGGRFLRQAARYRLFLSQNRVQTLPGYWGA